jgi:hypothetical protein
MMALIYMNIVLCYSHLFLRAVIRIGVLTVFSKHVKDYTCIVFPPAPQNPSSTTLPWHISAIYEAISSGVTENQPDYESTFFVEHDALVIL